MKSLFIVCCVIFFQMRVMAQEIKYGFNASAGKYLNVGDARIYYEVYGEGRPLMLLHGDVFGYIDEFSDHIPKLAKHFKVIAVGIRGHGKSELGTKPISYKLLAEDAMKVLKSESQDSAIVMGFSAGAIIGYHVAANYPKSIRKLVALGGALHTKSYRKEEIAGMKSMNIKELEENYPDFIKSRKAGMVQPDRYQELIDKLKVTWFEGDFIAPHTASDISCHVLTVGGDRDDYFEVGEFVSIHKTIKNSQLAIIPNCDHVGLIFRSEVLEATVLPFLLN